MKKRERCVIYQEHGCKGRRIPANISFLSVASFAPNFTEALAGDWLHRSFPFASGKYLSSYSPYRVLTALSSFSISPNLATPSSLVPHIAFLIFDARIFRSLFRVPDRSNITRFSERYLDQMSYRIR